MDIGNISGSGRYGEVRVEGVVGVDCVEHGPLLKGGARCFSKGKKRQLVTQIRDMRILTIV